MSYKEGSGDPQIGQVVRSYRRVAGAIDQMFQEMSARTEWESWRFDGIGSCAIPKGASEIGLQGIAREELIAQREEGNQADQSKRLAGNVCPYHRKDSGCSLGDLKSPMCLAHIENKGEIMEKFGIDPRELKDTILHVLNGVLLLQGGEQSVEDSVKKIEAVTAHVKTFPIIKNRIQIS